MYGKYVFTVANSQDNIFFDAMTILEAEKTFPFGDSWPRRLSVGGVTKTIPMTMILVRLESAQFDTATYYKNTKATWLM